MEYPHQNQTIRSEQLRAIGVGPFGALQMQQFFLLVAIQFGAPDLSKGLISGALGFGMLLNPLIMFIVNRLRIPLPRATGSLLITAGTLFIPAALSHNFNIYLPCIVTAVALFACMPTLITGYWQTNVMAEVRGRNFSKINMLQSISSLASGLLIGSLISKVDYSYILVGVSLFLIPAGLLTLRLPAPPPQGSRIPYASLKLFKQDKLFLYVCIVWSIFGFANLASLPLRIEYIASGNYGLKYEPWLVILVIQIIPQICIIFSSIIWGRFFDRFHFIAVRITLNLCFLLSILLFFHPSIYYQIGAAIFMGCANGGGGVVWNLWVTKIAPGHRTTDYMMVHVFTCGLRAVTGPLLAYHFLSTLSLYTMSYIGAGLLVLSSLLFVPLLWNHRFSTIPQNNN